MIEEELGSAKDGVLWLGFPTHSTAELYFFGSSNPTPTPWELRIFVKGCFLLLLPSSPIESWA